MWDLMLEVERGKTRLRKRNWRCLMQPCHHVETCPFHFHSSYVLFMLYVLKDRAVCFPIWM